MFPFPLPLSCLQLTMHVHVCRFPGLPDDEEIGLDSGFLVMTAEQIKDIFEPVVKEVCDLVQGQVDTLRAKGGVVSGIILVGGFGQSDYLYRRLKGRFTTSAAPPPYTERPTHAHASTSSLGDPQNTSVEVMQPVYAWTAVVRGAVLRGLEGNMVISRKARMHYGTSYATVYDEEKHSVTERYWSPLWERWMVSDRMQWHIAKVAPPSFFGCWLWCGDEEVLTVAFRERQYPRSVPSHSTTRATSARGSRSS
jgi:hypothetical protein